MECLKHNVCYNFCMSSNDRYRGNREYRDLTVQTHYKTPGRSARVQTKGSSMNDLSFSQNSVDARRPYEDTAFIERSRQQQRSGYSGQAHSRQTTTPPPYTRDPYPQGYQQPRSGSNNSNMYGYNKPAQAKNEVRPSPASDADAKKKAEKAAKEAAIKANSKPKVSKEVAMQIGMIFNIGIMLWCAAALVTIIVLLTGA